MPDLDTADRRELDDDQFAYIDSEGNRKLPLNDDAHVRDALSRYSQTDYESRSAKERARRKILAAARRHGVDVSEDDKVNRPVAG